jgi:hypothetical protein
MEWGEVKELAETDRGRRSPVVGRTLAAVDAGAIGDRRKHQDGKDHDQPEHRVLTFVAIVN